MKKNNPAPEPRFYMALVLKGSDAQYMRLLEFINNENVGQIIYQCKSQKYLTVSREDNVNFEAAFPQIIAQPPQSRRQPHLFP